MSKIFFEVIMAEKFDKEALKILNSRKNLILIDISKFKDKRDYQIKSFDASFLLQEKNRKIFDKAKLKFVTKQKPSKKQIQNAEFAYNVCKFVKSNAIVISSNSSTIGIGAGQMSRIDSAKIAAPKATERGFKTEGCTMASDAFFPFRDGIDAAAEIGITSVIQPGGSVKDDEVIQAADEADMAMIFTGIRHFRH